MSTPCILCSDAKNSKKFIDIHNAFMTDINAEVSGRE
jgi:hypothetical protein